MLLAFDLSSRLSGLPTSAHAYQFESQSILANFFMVHEWFSTNNFISKIPFVAAVIAHFGRVGAPNSVSWSISAEFFAYLCFPVVLLTVRRLGGSVVAIGLLSLGVFISNQYLIPADNLLRVLFCFSLGVALWDIRNSRYSNLLKMNILGRFSATVYLLILISLLTFHRSAAGGWAYILALFLVILIINALCKAEDFLSIFLSRKIAVYLGEISYAFYMIHWFAIKLTSQLLCKFIDLNEQTSSWYMLISFLTALVSAMIMHRYLENPARLAIQNMYDKIVKLKFRPVI
jgi:peptidoglycan/LPS O-acetylase OafA/YrhL